MSDTVKPIKVPWRDQDIVLRGGGWVRTWKSVDRPQRVCIHFNEHVYCNRMTRAETKRLIARLQVLLKSITPITKKGKQ